MKLLSRKEAQGSLRKENNDLVDTNLRLRAYEKAITERLQTLKDDYEPEKVAKLKEFEAFVKDITTKKTKLLREVEALDEVIKAKKDVYYGLIAKQDSLDEKGYEMEQEKINLNLRKLFVEDLEQKWREKELTN